MINENIKKTLNCISKNPKIILYTIWFIIFMSIVTTIHYVLEIKLNIDGDLRISMLKSVFNLLFRMIEFPLITAYTYIIIRKKFKLKRFLAFLHYKHFKFYLPVILFFYIPQEVLGVVLALARKSDITILIIVSIILILFFKIICANIAVFKVKFYKEEFISIAKKVFVFYKNNIYKAIAFITSFVPWGILQAYLIYLFYKKIIVPDVYIYELLPVCSYGLGVILFPYYILSTYFFINELHEKPNNTRR